MLKAIFFLIKLAVFSVAILVLANLFEWRGRTISDQVKTQMAHAERVSVVKRAKDWAGSLVRDAREGGALSASDPAQQKGSTESDGSEFSSTERQKLRALIRELNKSSARN